MILNNYKWMSATVDYPTFFFACVNEIIGLQDHSLLLNN